MAKPDRPTPPKPTPAPKAVPAPDPIKPPKPENDRLTIPITKDGRPDFESMRDKTKERVRKLITDPEVARELGVSADAAPAVATIPPVLTRALIQTLSQLDTIILSRITNAPASIVTRIGPYTADERDAIEPALDKVLNKYGGPLVGRWSDEIALAMVLTSITMAKIEAVRSAMQNAPRPVEAVVIPHPSAPPPADAPREPAPPAGDIPPEVIQ